MAVKKKSNKGPKVSVELTDDEKRIIKALAKEKKTQAELGNKVLDIAEIVKMVGRCEYVTLEDGTLVTINDMLVASAYGNALLNPETSFKDLLDAQKVANNDTSNAPQFNVTFVTNGQDLGD